MELAIRFLSLFWNPPSQISWYLVQKSISLLYIMVYTYHINIRSKNPIVVIANFADEIKYSVCLKLIGHCCRFDWDPDWDVWIPMVWWNCRANWNNLNELAMMTTSNQLTTRVPWSLVHLAIEQSIRNTESKREKLRYQNIPWNKIIFRHP